VGRLKLNPGCVASLFAGNLLENRLQVDDSGKSDVGGDDAARDAAPDI